jgi:31-O-methyltransferase
VRALAALLTHDDPSQLLFQVQEIAGDRCYERHGVTVREGDVVLDVGANVGVAAVYFATHCGAGRVHCFEPVAPVFALLERNAGALDACVLHPYGLGAAAARAPVTYYAGAAAMSGLHADPARDRALVRTALANLGIDGAAAVAQLDGRYEPEHLECEVRTLSQALRDEGVDRVDLLKIDVERAEADVLAGVAAEDWPRIGQVVVEVHDEAGRLRAIAAQLEAHGFTVAAEQEAAMRGTGVHLLYATRP